MRDCELNFTWGKMRTMAQEVAFLRARETSPKRWGQGESPYVCDFGEGEGCAVKQFAEGCHQPPEEHCQSRGADVTMKDFGVFLAMGDARIGLKKNLLKISNFPKTCFTSFPRVQSTSLLVSTLSSFQGAVKVSSCRSHSLQRQMPSASLQLTVAEYATPIYAPLAQDYFELIISEKLQMQEKL